MANNCSNLQKSLAWCQGTPELPGIKRRIYYIAKNQIVAWPTLPTDSLGRPTSAIYDGSFTLAADATWKYIDVLPDKCQVTSEAQGEVPSQTQLNKLTAVHPAVGAEASAAAAYINNADNVFLVEDMKGKYRVIGSDRWETKCTVAQDLGQGSTGTTSTTINAEATDVVPAPFYEGEIVTEDGTINVTETAPVLSNTWDFSNYTESVGLSTQQSYNGLTIVGSDDNDTVSADGVSFYGATKSDSRYIAYTPASDGILKAYFKSNGSSARGCCISESVSIIVNLAANSALEGTVSANVSAGKTYYICVDGGVTISKVEFYKA